MSEENETTQDDNAMKESSSQPDDNMGLNISGHILIRDKETGEELVKKRS